MHDPGFAITPPPAECRPGERRSATGQGRSLPKRRERARSIIKNVLVESMGSPPSGRLGSTGRM